MNVYSDLSPALGHNQFYLLLALSSRKLHGYALHGSVSAGSLGAVQVSMGRTYLTLKAMVERGLIEEAGLQDIGKHDKPRMTYRITPEGELRLKSELKRMKFAVECGERSGLFFEELPADIQRIINELR